MLHAGTPVSILALATVASAYGPPQATSWKNDFETADLKGLAVAPGWGVGLLPNPLTTGAISGGALNMTFDDPTPSSYWAPMLQKGWNMQLDKTKHYRIRFQLEAESETNDPIRVEFQWNDGTGDGISGEYNNTEEIVFDLHPNMGVRTFTFYTRDTVTWPAFAHFGKDSGDTAIDAFWIEFGDLETMTSQQKADLDGHVCKVHHIEFSEYTSAPEPLVLADYFPVQRTRDVSASAALWRLYNWIDANSNGVFDDDENYTVQYSGDHYLSHDKKETSGLWYPRIGLFDSTDRKLCEYHVLQAKACGIDGFAFQVSLLHVGAKPDQSNDVMYTMADFVRDMHYEFQIGLEFQNDTYAPWSVNGHSWSDRDDMIEHMAEDIRTWLDELYAGRETGLWIAGRPAFLFWSVAGGSPPGTITDSVLRAADLTAIRDHLNTSPSVWGATSGNPMLDPVFIARNAEYWDSLEGVLHGSFPLTNFTFQPDDDEWPWAYRHTLATFVSNSNSYFKTYYYDCEHWNGVEMPYYFGGTVRGYDDHKGHAWLSHAKAYVSNDSGEQIDEGFALFESQVSTGTPLCYVNQWSDYKEGTGLDPNREQGYEPLEKLASRIWNWRGQPGNYSATLIRLPERLLAVRTGIEFLLKAGYQVSDSEIVELTGYADDASRGIHRLSVSLADAALDLAEAELRALKAGLEGTWIDVRWTYPDVDDGLAKTYPTSPSTATVDGKTGFKFNQPTTGTIGRLVFAITDATARSKMNAGHFVGRARLEYLDDGTNWIAAETDNDAPDTYLWDFPRTLTDFLAKDSGQWRQCEFDVVNCDFDGRLTNAGDLQVTERLLHGSSTRLGALHSLRILGRVYEKP